MTQDMPTTAAGREVWDAEEIDYTAGRGDREWLRERVLAIEREAKGEPLADYCPMCGRDIEVPSTK